MLTSVYIALAFAFAFAYGALHARGRMTPTRAMMRALALGLLGASCLIEGAHVIGLALAAAAAEAAILPLRAASAALAAGFGWRTLYLLALVSAGGGPGLTPAGLILQAALALAVLGLMWRLWPRLRGVRAGAVVSAAIAYGPAWAALGLPAPLAMAATGALLLLAADAMTAWELFGAERDDPLRRDLPILAWATTFLGHVMLAAPFLAPPG